MRKMIGVCAILILGIAAVGSSGAQQGSRPSPAAKAECTLPDGKTITTNYSSPRMKGRKIFAEDGLVPYGKVWRAGANEATTFVTTANLTVEGTAVHAGSYTLFVIPNPDKWTLIINKKTGEFGIPYKYESDELARVDMRVSTLSSPLEDFTIAYHEAADGCSLSMEWDTTRASLTFREEK
jgi:Protein of unknown function (DUF2911)